MDSAKIQTFFTLAKTLSYAKTSETLFLSSSVVSRQISQLEDELGLTLFFRDSKSVSLTPAGEYFLRGMKELSGRFESLLSESHSIEKGYAGQINIGLLTGQLLSVNYSELIRRFRSAKPEINLNIAVYSYPELEQKLKNHELDFALCAVHGLLATGDFLHVDVGESRTLLFIPASHPLADADPNSLSLKDFESDAFITYSDFEERGGAVSAERFFEKVGFKPSTVIKAPNVDTMLLMLEAGLGVALLNESSILCGNTWLKTIPLPELEHIQESIVWSRSSAKACNGVFLDFIQKNLSNR